MIQVLSKLRSPRTPNENVGEPLTISLRTFLPVTLLAVGLEHHAISR